MEKNKKHRRIAYFSFYLILMGGVINVTKGIISKDDLSIVSGFGLVILFTSTIYLFSQIMKLCVIIEKLQMRE